MTCFHSDKAMAMLARLPNAKPEDVPLGVPDVTPLTRSFRALRKDLRRDGWFKRNPMVEAAQVRVARLAPCAQLSLSCPPSRSRSLFVSLEHIDELFLVPLHPVLTVHSSPHNLFGCSAQR